MLQDLISPFISIKNVDGVYWSLAVEIIFYAIMGVFFAFRWIKKIEFPLAIWLFVAYIIRGLNLFLDSLIISGLQFYGIMLYCQLFIAGVMFYKLKSENKKRYHFIILFCLVYEFLFNGLIQGTAVFIFFILFYSLINDRLQFFIKRPFVFLGTISYSLYLVHQNIGYVIINFLENKGFVDEVYIIIPIVISIFLATFITFYIEKPIQNVIRKREMLYQDSNAI